MLPAVLASPFFLTVQGILDGKADSREGRGLESGLERAEHAVAGKSHAWRSSLWAVDEVLDGGQLGNAGRGIDLALDEKAHTLKLSLVAAGQLQRQEARLSTTMSSSAAATATYGRPACASAAGQRPARRERR
jgi:hypothetical protein